MPTLSSFDERALRDQFRAVLELNPEIDLTVTGFDVGQIDVALEMGDAPAGGDLADSIPEPEEPVTSRPGDIFDIGPHRVAVGDGRDLDLLKSRIL